MWFASSLAGGLIGAIVTLLIQSLFALRNMQISDINDQISQISTIEALSVEYWLSPGETDPGDERIKAARLRGALHASTAFEPTAQSLFDNSYEEYKNLDGELFDCATGGFFETAGRKADPERAVSVIEASIRLRSILRKQRSKMYWAR